MAYTFWSNVQVAVQSALGSALTISAITQANPPVVTSTAHGLANGDFVVLDVQGMFQLDSVVARVANVAANTFELEGIDGSAFNTFTSGTAREVTFGYSMTNVVDVNASGGEPEFADITTIHQSIRTRVPVLTSPLTFSMTGLFDPSDDAMQELARATRAITERAIQFEFSNGNVMVFNSYPSAPGVPTGSAQQAVQTPITLECQGLPTIYEV
jgi:hypothetical protein